MKTSRFVAVTAIFCYSVLTSFVAADSLGTWPSINVGKPAKVFISGVAYGQGRWVVVGQSGFISTSTDGVKWSRKSAGIKRDFNDVCFTGVQFVAVCKAPDTGEGAKIWTSTDGSKWTPRDSDASGDAISQGLHAVSSDGSGTVIAVGGIFGQMTRSFDHGNTWQRVLPDSGQSWPGLYAVGYGKGAWICGGYNNLMRSTDSGATWTVVSTTQGARDVCYGNNRWFVTDVWKNKMYWSANGTTWQNVATASGFGNTSTFSYAHSCTYADGLFIAVTEYGDIWTSENAREVKLWRAGGGDPDIWSVTPGKRGFIAVGGDFDLNYGSAWASPPWLKARLGGPWDHPFTAFDAEDSPPKKIALPEYRVNTASLNLHLQGTLFHMPTLGTATSFRLAYSSSPVADDASGIGPFGKNWRSSYDSVLGAFGHEVRLVTGGGHSMQFVTPDGEDLSSVTSGSLQLLSPEGNSDVLTYHGAAIGFTLMTRATRLTYHYSVSGGPGNALWFLTRIVDRNDNEVVINVVTDENGGQVTKVTDPAGRELNFYYNEEKRCTRVVTPDNREITFGYDSHQNLVSITDMAGYQASYIYDELGFLKKMTTAGRVNRFAWEPRPGYEDATSAQENAGDLIIHSVTTSSGTVIQYNLLSDGAGVRRSDPSGQETVFESLDGRTTSITQPEGTKNKVTFNELKLPASFTDELGHVTQISYDDQGYPSKIEDALGHETQFTYNDRGNLISRVDPLGQTWQFTYDSHDNLQTTRSPLNHVTTYEYHGNGRLWKTTDARNGQSVNLYNANGDLTSQTDACGNTATYSYDGVSRCTSMIDRAGQTKSISYDANDRITELTYTSAAGSPQRSFEHDAFGQTRYTDELGNSTSIKRNDFGYITQIVDPLGNVAKTDYNSDNLPVQVTDPLGRVTSTVYDADGRPITITDAMGKKTTREYNDQGSLVKLTDPRKAATTFDYDENNRLTMMTDPLGKKVFHERDALGRVTLTSNGRGEQIRITYDADGRVTKKEYKSNAPGSAFAEIARSTFDDNNNLLTCVDAWGTTSWTYDACNRALSITYPDGQSLSFTYSPTGRLASTTYPDGLMVTCAYDAFNRQKVPSVFRSGSEVVGIREIGSNMTDLTMTLGGETAQVSFLHDEAGRLVDVNRSLLPASASSIHSTYSYDANGQPTQIRHDLPAGTAFDWQLQYDAVGNVITETHAGSDHASPLLPAPANITYDLSGRIKVHTKTAYSYDDDGNLTSVAGGLFQASYNAENRPTNMQRGIGDEIETSTHLYGGSGLRVRREIGGEVIYYHYGPGDRLLFTTNGSGALLARYIWGDRGLLAAVKGNTLSAGLQHYLTGRLMSVAGLVDAEGTILATYAYDPLGHCARIIKKTGFVDDNPFTFVGGLGVLDEGAGLYYMRNRFYDASTGRFLQKDPAGFEGGINLYAYAAGNPVNSVDPAGTWDINWARFTKGVKQIAVAGVGIGLAAVTAPITGPVAGTLAAIATVNAVYSASFGVCNVVVSVSDPKETSKAGETFDQIDGFGKILGVGAGAIATGMKAVFNGGNMDTKELERNMKIGSGVGSTVDLAANGARWNLPTTHVLNTLNNIATADSVGQAYGETAAVLIKESQDEEQPESQSNAPADDSNAD
ncbi:MAG: hypothetical protein OJI67_23785 [Prosthecobacter sp.]|nr:hypothetical protein [Prosthecobacter sp.]